MKNNKVKNYSEAKMTQSELIDAIRDIEAYRKLNTDPQQEGILKCEEISLINQKLPKFWSNS